MSDIKRQHPVMILMGALQGLSAIIVPAVAFSFYLVMENGVKVFLIIIPALLLFMAVNTSYAYLKWKYFTYSYRDGYLLIKSGVIIKKRRSIKRERIQAINVSRGLVQRLFNLVSLEIETAGGLGEAELTLDAITREEAADIKEKLKGAGIPVTGEAVTDEAAGEPVGEVADGSGVAGELGGEVPGVPGEPGVLGVPGEPGESGAKSGKPGVESGVPGVKSGMPGVESGVPGVKSGVPGLESGEHPGNNQTNTCHLPLRRLAVAGATSGEFLILFSIILTLLSQSYSYLPDRILDMLIERAVSFSIQLIIGAALVLLILSWLVSVIHFMVRYADFFVRRAGDRVEVSWGIIVQRQLSMKLHRLQSVSVTEGVLREFFRLCSVTAEIAGGRIDHNKENATILCLLLNKNEIPRFLQKILPEYSYAHHLTPLPARAKRRYIFRAVIPVLLLLPPFIIWVPCGWLLSLLLIPAFLLGLWQYRAGGIAIDGNQFTLRYRILSRQQVIMFRRNIQAMEVTVNPLQKWQGLCTLQVTVLSNIGGSSFRLVDLDQKDASEAWNWFARSPS